MSVPAQPVPLGDPGTAFRGLGVSAHHGDQFVRGGGLLGAQLDFRGQLLERGQGRQERRGLGAQGSQGRGAGAVCLVQAVEAELQFGATGNQGGQPVLVRQPLLQDRPERTQPAEFARSTVLAKSGAAAGPPSAGGRSGGAAGSAASSGSVRAAARSSVAAPAAAAAARSSAVSALSTACN